MPDLAPTLQRRLAGILAAVESCSKEGNDANIDGSTEAGHAAEEGGENLPREAGIAASERARRKGDWEGLVRVLEASLCDAVAGNHIQNLGWRFFGVEGCPFGPQTHIFVALQAVHRASQICRSIR